ncbi:maleylpyruvate isomerase N-terminal domain-containing protein [Streptomyces sp. NBC_01498]|uniref:maleylpyruvate isomerase N-terminal domain-containing protein n=1 Tax=Streptomyces sp. NBC_01498 TaxID=2975870 RepID=UPI002E7C441B|nr:maleylpyruvate isomerase N-terminal domain-containing protein [Streptomyces sp. NBC_01498]WTL24967.1 maleylpyruvate isomerase N-terminal domain-containing protein [Streptomyces sp. NBC_01498]
MEKTLEFPVLLRMIDERAVVFRAAVASAPSLDVRVPTCPEWTLLDLVRHLGEVHRHWADVVTAGLTEGSPADPASNSDPETALDAGPVSDPEAHPGTAPGTAPDSDPQAHPGTAPGTESDPAPDVAAGAAPAVPGEPAALLAWSAGSTERLLGALRESGPDRGCRTWWGGSQSPQTSGAVARHQVQEAAVHTYDARITVGAPQPLPDDAALDGVDEFLSTCCGGFAWPYEPSVIDFHATEGASWRLSLPTGRARLTRLPVPGTGPEAATAADDPDVAYASARGTAAELVLVLYGRVPLDSLTLGGERRLFDLLEAWDPEE